MRRSRIGWRYAVVGIGLLTGVVAVAAPPWFLRPLVHGRRRTPVYLTSPVRRADMTVTTTAGGRVDSSERTVIECRLERIDVGVRGNSIGAGGASTVLSVMPEGSVVKKGDVLCVLDSSDYEEILRQQEMTVERSKADHQAAGLTVDIARTALREYRDGLMRSHRQELQGKIALAESDLERSVERLRWTNRMNDKGYIPKGQLTGDSIGRDRAEDEVRNGRESLRMFEKYYAPKYLHILNSEIVGAQAILEFQTARLKRNTERLDRLRRQVERCTIRAPHDGLLIYANEERRNVVIQEGMTVRERQKLFYLPNLSFMEVEAMIHESVVDQVRAGMPARVRVEGLDEQLLEGHVSSVSPLPIRQEMLTDATFYAGIVKLDTIPEGLKPGMTAEVLIRTGLVSDALTVPSEAVTTEAGHDVCYVASDDHVERREVTVGRHTRELLEVTAGLGEGERVVLDPSKADPVVVPTTELPEEVPTSDVAG